MDNSERDVVLSAWKHYGKKDLTSKDILNYLSLQGDDFSWAKSYSNPRVKLDRFLKPLIGDDIEKVQNPEDKKEFKFVYRLKRNPVEFEVFAYLNNLRKKYSRPQFKESQDNFLQKSCLSQWGLEGENAPKTEDEKQAYESLSKRLMDIFEAMNLLRNTIVLRRFFGVSGVSIPLYETTIKEVTLSRPCENAIRENKTEKLDENNNLPESDVFKLRKLAVDDILMLGNNGSRTVDWLSDLPLRNTVSEIKGVRENLRRHKTLSKNLNYLLEEYGKFLKEEMASLEEYLPESTESPKEDELAKIMANGRKRGLYRQAVLVQFAEFMKEKNIDLDDFAIVLTRNPQSLATNCSAEQELYQKWQVIKDTKSGKLDTELCKLYRDQMEREPMRALALLLLDSPIEIEEFRRIAEKKWVEEEFGKEYPKFLKYYAEETKKKKDNEIEKKRDA